MPANLRTCADCSTQYALDLAACPHCGSSNYTEEEGVVTKRLPLFVSLSCPDCGRGPWTVRLEAVTSGLVALPTLACASCGSRVPVTWPPEEEPMSPKITVHGGASNARDADVSPAADASQPLVGAEADQGHPLPGTETPEDPGTEPDTEPEDAGETSDAADDAYAGMTLAELRSAADARGIASYGTKAQITERLREADEAAAETPEAE